jgi:3-oxoacyl-[acyl-carrier protein] reductase
VDVGERFQNKVAVVTGGSRGIGRSIAQALGREGAAVAVNYRSNAAAAEEVVRRITADGGRAVAVCADIAAAGAAETIFEQAGASFGRVDILVCNAGIAAVMPLTAIADSDYERIYGVNVRSLVFLLRTAAKSLNDHGRIVTLASTVAAFPREGMALYASSKAAVRALTEVASIELGPRGITANSVLPGLIETDMIAGLPPAQRQAVAQSSPFGRIGVPDDITGLVTFLASEESRWITGQSIVASGGARR